MKEEWVGEGRVMVGEGERKTRVKEEDWKRGERVKSTKSSRAFMLWSEDEDLRRHRAQWRGVSMVR